MAAWNAVLRFGIEVAALAGLAAGGWAMGRSWWRWVLAIVLPVGAALLWGTFRVPGDPGDAAVVVSGTVRLLIEAAVLVAAVVGMFLAVERTVAFGYLIVTLFHYVTSLGRLRWLLEH